MKRVTAWILGLALISACAQNTSQTGTFPLTVFAAASLSGAFDEIASAFESTHANADVILNFAGSNTLRAQIEAGANADVFASANSKEMDTLVANGLVSEGKARIFASNRLVIITPKGNPAGLSTFDGLALPGLKLVLAAREVPVGRYARQALENAGGAFEENVLANVVSNETDVKQVLAKVQLGEADAGIVYASDAVAAQELKVIEIPDVWNVQAAYPIAALANAREPELADQFIEYVLSPKGQTILQEWGFSLP